MTIKWPLSSLSQRGQDQTQPLPDFSSVTPNSGIGISRMPSMLLGAGDVRKTMCLRLRTSQSVPWVLAVFICSHKSTGSVKCQSR